MTPTPFQIFCGYYLGLGTDFQGRFFNINSLAAHFGIAPGELRTLMEKHHLTPETTRHVNYNIAKAFATAQDMSIEGHKDDIERYARQAFEEFCQALGSYDEKQDFENVDYDNLMPGDPKKGKDGGALD